MIVLDSRYADGTGLKVYDAWSSKQNYQLAIIRNWPTYTVDYFIYNWGEMDRLDSLASKYLGNSDLWWQILDINPEFNSHLKRLLNILDMEESKREESIINNDKLFKTDLTDLNQTMSNNILKIMSEINNTQQTNSSTHNFRHSHDQNCVQS